MNIETLRAFFMWCTIIDGAILVLWTAVLASAPGWVYRMHGRWFPMSREAFNIVMYAFLGAFKLLILAFNVVPFVALTLAE
jgi:hypothetical protein